MQRPNGSALRRVVGGAVKTVKDLIRVVIVVAVDFIALVVYKWRVSANNGALVTGVIYNLGGC